MPLPNFYPFKTRHYQSSSSSSNSIHSVGVVARGEFLGAFYATTPVATHSAAANLVDITVNGTTAIGGAVVTTSTGDGSSNLGTPSAKTYVKAGDALATVYSSCTGGVTTYLVREF